MSNDFESKVWDALKGVKFPGMSRDIVSFGFVHQVQAIAGTVAVDLQMATHNPAAGEKVREEVERTLRALPGVEEVKVNIQVVKPPGREEAAQKAISQDANLIRLEPVKVRESLVDTQLVGCDIPIPASAGARCHHGCVADFRLVSHPRRRSARLGTLGSPYG